MSGCRKRRSAKGPRSFLSMLVTLWSLFLTFQSFLSSFRLFLPDSFERPEKWDDSQVGFRGGSASGGRTVLLPSAFWAHGASKMATLGATLYFTAFQSLGGHASARRVLHEPCFRQAHCFVQGPLRFISLCPQIPVVPAPTFGASRFLLLDSFCGRVIVVYPPLKKITCAKKFQRNYFRGDCDGVA